MIAREPIYAALFARVATALQEVTARRFIFFHPGKVSGDVTREQEPLFTEINKNILPGFINF